jgi:hypothetical protein
MTAQRSRPAAAAHPPKTATLLLSIFGIFSLLWLNLAHLPLAGATAPEVETGYRAVLPAPLPGSLANTQRFRSGAPGATLAADRYQGGTRLLSNSPTGVGKIQARGDQLVDANGLRYFIAGINYEGPSDRAWAMWRDDKFDPVLIGQNMALAAAGGYNSVRIFIQDSLRDDIRANNWSKLDKVADLAQQNGLRLLITFADYYEAEISKLAHIDRLVAQHFSGSPVILGYDLRNEPQFAELISAIYPGGPVALQTEDMIRLYGERITQSAADTYRAGPGHSKVPSQLDSRQAYIYLNMLKLYDEFQNDVYTWVSNNSRVTDMDFFGSYESVKWNSFIGALNATVQRYIDVRQSAINQADPGRLTTIGWNRPEMARLAANNSLGFISFHRFPGDSAEGLAGTLSMINYLKAFYQGKPVVMEEFGYSNFDGKNQVPLLKTASYESSVWLFLYGRGYAGGFKWMLNNFTTGPNQYENNFGLLDDNDRPKPAYYASRAVLQMAAANRQPNGDFERLETFDGVTITYSWKAHNAQFGNGTEFRDSRFTLNQSEVAPWSIWWSEDNEGQVTVSTTAPGTVTLDLKALFAGWKPGTDVVVAADSKAQPEFNHVGEGKFTLRTQPGELYTVKAPVNRAAFNRAAPRPDANNQYFNETGHNLSNIFRDYWLRKGGLSIYGFPISEEFMENGYTVQYFERARFEHHPEYKGQESEVLLGLLGHTVTGGRKEAGEYPFQPVAPFNSTATEFYFKETGHSLRGGFKTFWQTHGGLSQYGYPISEEFQEVNPSDGKTYTVQYFERNRFEWHPEYVNTPAEFLLGLLGQQVARARGWLVI